MKPTVDLTNMFFNAEQIIEYVERTPTYETWFFNYPYKYNVPLLNNMLKFYGTSNVYTNNIFDLNGNNKIDSNDFDTLKENIGETKEETRPMTKNIVWNKDQLLSPPNSINISRNFIFSKSDNFTVMFKFNVKEEETYTGDGFNSGWQDNLKTFISCTKTTNGVEEDFFKISGNAGSKSLQVSPEYGGYSLSTVNDVLTTGEHSVHFSYSKDNGCKLWLDNRLMSLDDNSNYTKWGNNENIFGQGDTFKWYIGGDYNNGQRPPYTKIYDFKFLSTYLVPENEVSALLFESVINFHKIDSRDDYPYWGDQVNDYNTRRYLIGQDGIEIGEGHDNLSNLKQQFLKYIKQITKKNLQYNFVIEVKKDSVSYGKFNLSPGFLDDINDDQIDSESDELKPIFINIVGENSDLVKLDTLLENKKYKFGDSTLPESEFTIDWYSRVTNDVNKKYYLSITSLGGLYPRFYNNMSYIKDNKFQKVYPDNEIAVTISYPNPTMGDNLENSFTFIDDITETAIKIVDNEKIVDLPNGALNSNDNYFKKVGYTYDKDFKYFIINNNAILLGMTGYNGEIPETLGAYDVTELADDFIIGRKDKLLSLTIPDSVESIGASAFRALPIFNTSYNWK